MPSKVYVSNYPAGDFRAMPAIGDGHALLKWVTSFPGNPARGLPTVTGLVLLSDAEDGRLLAVLDAAAVTALRTAAAGVLAADTLCRAEASSYAVIGAGVNGAETARMLVAHGVTPLVWDVDEAAAQLVAERLGARVAASARGGAGLRGRRHRDAGRRGSVPGRLARGRPARVAHGRRRAREGGGRDRGAPPRAPLLRRLGAGEPRRRARSCSRARTSSAATTSPSSAPSSSARRTAAGAPGDITLFDSTGPRDPGPRDREGRLREGRRSSTCNSWQL